MGNGLPQRGLILSPQHRVYIPNLGALVVARALTVLAQIGKARTAANQQYIHLLLRQHSVLLAERMPCESFWPGPIALTGLPPDTARHVQPLLGPNPKPARPFMRVQDARHRLKSAFAPAAAYTRSNLAATDTSFVAISLDHPTRLAPNSQTWCPD